jgi:hypothetical protein
MWHNSVFAAHSSLGWNYDSPVCLADMKVAWTGNSSWWIIKSNEYHNRDRISDMGNFLQCFSPNAFGGTNYLNTPIGAVTHVEEPGSGSINVASIYFGLWDTGENFVICAWASRIMRYLQAVGDPFVTK